MAELARTNDVVAISALEGVLQEAGIECFVADRNASVIDGSNNFVQMRLLVSDETEAVARQWINDAGLEDLLRPARRGQSPS